MSSTSSESINLVEDDDFLCKPTYSILFSQVKDKGSTSSKPETYLSQIDSQLKEEFETFINGDHCSSQLGPYEYYNVYLNCPICMSKGYKRINHIKKCANENKLKPRNTIQLLRSCIKLRKPITNNVTRNIKITKPIKVDKQYEIQIIGIEFKKELISKRINKLLSINDYSSSSNYLSMYEDLPLFWKMSNLKYDLSDYIVNGFHRYFLEQK
ncbi:hypothetical protein BLOT_012532 [Blomia tropicalis]|nr:hypothetical protein BLOT_012532 [Blomia tropicalis]